MTEGDDEEIQMGVVAEVDDLDLALLQTGASYQIIGIETDSPVLRIGAHTYVGEYEDIVGTDLVFAAASQSSQPQQDEYSAESSLVCTSAKRLRFRKATVTEKKQQPSLPVAGTCADEPVTIE